MGSHRSRATWRGGTSRTARAHPGAVSSRSAHVERLGQPRSSRCGPPASARSASLRLRWRRRPRAPCERLGSRWSVARDCRAARGRCGSPKGQERRLVVLVECEDRGLVDSQQSQNVVGRGVTATNLSHLWGVPNRKLRWRKSASLVTMTKVCSAAYRQTDSWSARASPTSRTCVDPV